jgi:multidrug efflux pump subunit AcrB
VRQNAIAPGQTRRILQVKVLSGGGDAVFEARVSRLRPVLLGAGTTVLGVIPLLQDAFWVSMAMTIMAGLTFGTILTMIMVPVLYATLHGISASR